MVHKCKENCTAFLLSSLQNPSVSASGQPSEFTLDLCTERNTLKHKQKGNKDAAFYVIKTTHHPFVFCRVGPIMLLQLMEEKDKEEEEEKEKEEAEEEEEERKMIHRKGSLVCSF